MDQSLNPISNDKFMFHAFAPRLYQDLTIVRVPLRFRFNVDTAMDDTTKLKLTITHSYSLHSGDVLKCSLRKFSAAKQYVTL